MRIFQVGRGSGRAEENLIILGWENPTHDRPTGHTHAFYSVK
jgi:hypothetical protein